MRPACSIADVPSASINYSLLRTWATPSNCAGLAGNEFHGTGVTCYGTAPGRFLWAEGVDQFGDRGYAVLFGDFAHGFDPVAVWD